MFPQISIMMMLMNILTNKPAAIYLTRYQNQLGEGKDADGGGGRILSKKQPTSTDRPTTLLYAGLTHSVMYMLYRKCIISSWACRWMIQEDITMPCFGSAVTGETYLMHFLECMFRYESILRVMVQT